MIIIKKLNRSKNDKVFSGVLGGIGQYFNINPIFLRILYVFISINSFFTMTLVYLVFTAIIPLDNDIIEEDDSYPNKSSNNSFLGIGLIILGIILLSNNLLPIYFPHFLSMIRSYSRRLINFWPVIFIVLGIYLLVDKNE